ncbi:hypothetical protein G3I60_16125 [Streptomyces sp. SID13666]|uniref:hypothetical protein n=1 Tax=Streptomyces TaxID=1883 RepID=UPI0013C064A7|nr:hypothetical protein [Streptomyces sp. SID13666]NEA55637.1 hypothetical protein [Streptomyces sp. SID13666]
MTTPTPRPDIIALLCSADFIRLSNTDIWTHRDGRPFSREEQARVLEATRAEREEVRMQHTRYRNYLQEAVDAPETLQRFLAPFMQQLTEKNLGNAVELMSKDEYTEFERLLGFVAEPVRPFTANTF